MVSADAVMMGPGAPALVPFLSHVSIVDSGRSAHAEGSSDLDERLRSHAKAGTSQEAFTCNGSSHAGQKATDRTIGACYTAALLKSILLLMGCKPRVAHKASKNLFEGLTAKLTEHLGFHATLGHCNPPSKQVDGKAKASDGHLAGACLALNGLDITGKVVMQPGGKAIVTLQRPVWEQLVMEHIQAFTDKPHAREDLALACSIREQRRSVTVLLAGTSGTGKSTLAGLLAARLGISTVLSTDSVRHMLRSFTPQASNPVLWASTYEAGHYMDDGSGLSGVESLPGSAEKGKAPAEALLRAETLKRKCIKGYKAQSEMVLESLDKLIGACEGRRESLVVEGVHLSLNAVIRLMQKHPSIVPFLVHISNEAKHRERFAVRAKYMTLEPTKNRYVRYMRSIRIIQDYLIARAQRHAVPAVNNTNVDRSVATIHATTLACLRRQARGEVLLDAASKTTPAVAEEYAHYTEGTWSSKGMLELIRQKMSTAALDSDDRPSTSTSSPLGPLSEVGELRDPTEDTHSIYGDSDLMSSDGRDQDDELDDDSGSEADPREEGSVADSDAEEHEFEEIACTSGGPRAESE